MATMGGTDQERYKKLAAVLDTLEAELTAWETEGQEIIRQIHAAVDQKKLAHVRKFINQKISSS